MICECGHDKRCHRVDKRSGNYCYESSCHLCKCKKFNQVGLKEPEGCGKEVGVAEDRYGDVDIIQCGESNANYKCCLCGAMWCQSCAEHGGYQCECEPITLELISKSDKNNGK